MAATIENSDLFPPADASESESAKGSSLESMAKWLNGFPPVVVWVATVFLAVMIGWLDYSTGWEMSLFIFYALPIFIVVWHSGLLSGLVMTAICGVVWMLANESSHPYETNLGYGWAMVSRLFYFGVVAFAVNSVRRKQQADAAHILMLEERRQMERDIVSVSEHEQQRIGQDLHDGLCQQLAAIGCAARVLAEDLQAQKLSAAEDAVLIEESLKNAVVEARALARGIFPVHVDRSGLSAALADLGRTTGRLTGAKIDVRAETEINVDSPEAAMHLYRIAQEALANAVRHSEASQITIVVTVEGNQLKLMIEDNGKGINFRTGARNGMGLRTMQYRAQALGGLLDVKDRKGGGTVVTCVVEINKESP
jgi:signal transduction histidine kinase